MSTLDIDHMITLLVVFRRNKEEIQLGANCGNDMSFMLCGQNDNKKESLDVNP